MKTWQRIAFTGLAVPALIASLAVSACQAPVPPSPPAPAPAPAPAPTPVKPIEVKPIELRWSSFLGSTHNLAKDVTQPWADEVEKRSGGRLTVEIYWGGALHGAKEGMKAILEDITDVTYVWPSYHPGEFHLAEFDQLPGVFPNCWVATRVLEELYDEYFRSEYENVGVVMGWMQTVPNMHIVSAKKPIRTVGDLKGMKIRCGAGLATDLWQMVGATPVHIPSAEMYPALQRGLVDCAHYHLSGIEGSKLYEVAKYVAVVGDGIIAAQVPVVFNPKTWKALPDDLKKIVYELSREAVMWEADSYEFLNRDALGRLVKRGMEIYGWPEAEVAKIWKIAAPLTEETLKKTEEEGYPRAREYYAKMLELSAKYGKMSREEIIELQKTNPVPMEKLTGK